MRLIGTFDSGKHADAFSSFLTKEGIANSYELSQGHYQLWVNDEDDLEHAEQWLEKFKKDPEDPTFKRPEVIDVLPASTVEPPSKRIKVEFRLKRTSAPLTNFFLVVCAFLFFWSSTEEVKILKEKGPVAVQLSLTPVMQHLMFDYPYAFQLVHDVVMTYPMNSLEEIKDLPPEGQALYQKAESTPTWKGVYDLVLHPGPPFKEIPLFEKIRQGEVWRVFTPALLHRDFLHILFNMAWLWVLGRQIEERIRKWRMLLLIVAIGIFSNVAQYLMSGPYFLGFSGIVVGMAGFIWVRQKLAPWEGYPLQRSTLVFVGMFVVAMFALEFISFLLQVAHVIDFSPNIANTAHIAGGLAGILLARLPLFAKEAK